MTSREWPQDVLWSPSHQPEPRARGMCARVDGYRLWTGGWLVIGAITRSSALKSPARHAAFYLQRAAHNSITGNTSQDADALPVNVALWRLYLFSLLEEQKDLLMFSNVKHFN